MASCKHGDGGKGRCSSACLPPPPENSLAGVGLPQLHGRGAQGLQGRRGTVMELGLRMAWAGREHQAASAELGFCCASNPAVINLT